VNPSNQTASSPSVPAVLADGFAMGESVRWRHSQLWLADWGAQEIVALDATGARTSVVPVPFALPFCFDWLADGRMVIVAGREARLVRLEADGSLVTHADLAAISATPWNEIVVDERGNAYVNNGEAIALVTPDGTARQVAGSSRFPNGMAITPDNRTLILAESHGKCLTAFDIEEDGSLSNRRLWAELEGPPDGISLDAEGAVWYAEVPGKRCVRVREGGEVLETIAFDRGGFSCALAGEDGRTLYIAATEWRGMDKVEEVAAAKTGQVLAARVKTPAAGR
jgi:sugar lactone lactonase YvrE